MRSIVLLLLIFAAAQCVAQEPKLWFVFLVRGDGKRPPAPELEKLQKRHIANFRRLFGEKKLLAAGPLQDPTQFKRGIVVLWVPTMKDVQECFLPDQYVQLGIMNLQVGEWKANRDGINTADPDPNAIEENRFAYLHGKANIPSYLLKEHERWIRDEVRPAVSGAFASERFEEALIFHGDQDSDRILLALQKDPLVRLGWVELEYMPLWMAKGSVRG
jgi:uncharacterized protein YciI